MATVEWGEVWPVVAYILGLWMGWWIRGARQTVLVLPKPEGVVRAAVAGKARLGMDMEGWAQESEKVGRGDVAERVRGQASRKKTVWCRVLVVAGKDAWGSGRRAGQDESDEDGED